MRSAKLRRAMSLISKIGGHSERDLDETVRKFRSPGSQQTAAGERGVHKTLRRSLLKCKLHADQDLLDRASSYIVQYC